MEYLQFISLAANAILSVLLYLLKTIIDDNKERMTKIEEKAEGAAKDIVEVKVHYLLKNDFSEFKDELWRKLDDLKEIVKHNA